MKAAAAMLFGRHNLSFCGNLTRFRRFLTLWAYGRQLSNNLMRQVFQANRGVKLPSADTSGTAGSEAAETVEVEELPPEPLDDEADVAQSPQVSIEVLSKLAGPSGLFGPL